MRAVVRKIGFLMIAAFVAAGSFTAYKIVKWKSYMWIPSYISSSFEAAEKVNAPRHVIFVFVDHYEPGKGEKGVERNRKWLEDYRELASRHKDSYGRPLQHTWFYAYDHKNVDAVLDISKAVYDGFGEIEFHWHHGPDTNELFPGKVNEGLEWFETFGAMRQVGNGMRSFGFIHGNWALDNSGKPEHCGVSRELEILKEAGCYADFTFPSLGNVAQPRKINSIYYAKDDEGPKSHEDGENSRVGKVNREGLLIFEGPLGFSMGRQLFEYGAVEEDNLASPERADKWVDSNITVEGRPEWVFVKVYTHGIQGRKIFFSRATDEMFSHIEEKYSKGNYRLHYVTAREAFNIVRAAEDGLSGDPDEYRDYEIKPPVNRFISADMPLEFVEFSADNIEFSPVAIKEGAYSFRLSPIEKVEGALVHFMYKNAKGKNEIRISGKGEAKVVSKARLSVSPKAASVRKEKGLFVYSVELGR